MKNIDPLADASAYENEENFLQNLISAHTIAAGMLESALKNLRLEADADRTVLSRLEKSVHALRRMETLIQKRKESTGSGTGNSEAA